jgi:hypothetical protein
MSYQGNGTRPLNRLGRYVAVTIESIGSANTYLGKVPYLTYLNIGCDRYHQRYLTTGRQYRSFEPGSHVLRRWWIERLETLCPCHTCTAGMFPTRSHSGACKHSTATIAATHGPARSDIKAGVAPHLFFPLIPAVTNVEGRNPRKSALEVAPR